MPLPERYHRLLYDTALHYTCNETVLNSPPFHLPLEHYVIHFALLTLIHLAPASIWRTCISYPLLMCHLYASPLSYLSPKGDALTLLCHWIVMTQIGVMTTTIFLSYPELNDFRISYGMDIARSQPYTWNKLVWAFQRCFVNMRGVGWNFQVKSVNNSQESKNNTWHFIIFKCLLWEIGAKYCLYDLALFIYNVMMLDPFELERQSSVIVTLFAILNYNYIISLSIGCLTATTIIYYGLNASYWCMAIISLSLGLSQVNDWPDAFQLGKGGFSMCSFWSNWWHQYLSRDAYILSKKIVDWLNIYKAPTLRRYLLVLTTFMICGAIHAIASLNLPWNGNLNYNPLVPQWVPKELYIGIFNTKFSPNRCFYSLFLFFYSANVVFAEVAFQIYVLGPLSKHWSFQHLWTFKFMACLWMLGVQAWPVLMYMQELHQGGLNFPMYLSSLSLTSLIN